MDYEEIKAKASLSGIDDVSNEELDWLISELENVRSDRRRAYVLLAGALIYLEDWSSDDPDDPCRTELCIGIRDVICGRAVETDDAIRSGS